MAPLLFFDAIDGDDAFHAGTKKLSRRRVDSRKKIILLASRREFRLLRCALPEAIPKLSEAT